MFSKEDGIRDTFPDEAGKLARRIFPRAGWTAKAAEKREELVSLLESNGYISFDASVKNYGAWSVGESMLFFVPVERRGALSVFHEQVVRLVCVRTGRYTRGLMAGPIEAPTELRAKLLRKLSKNQSFRLATNVACAPFLTHYLKSLGIRGNNRSDGFTFLAAREDSSMSSAWTMHTGTGAH